MKATPTAWTSSAYAQGMRAAFLRGPDHVPPEDGAAFLNGFRDWRARQDRPAPPETDLDARMLREAATACWERALQNAGDADADMLFKLARAADWAEARAAAGNRDAREIVPRCALFGFVSF